VPKAQVEGGVSAQGTRFTFSMGSRRVLCKLPKWIRAKSASRRICSFLGMENASVNSAADFSIFL